MVPGSELGDEVIELVGVDCDPSILGKAQAKFRRKRRDKEFKVKKKVVDFTVSKEHTLERVEGLSSRVLVGRLEYEKMTRLELLKWAQKNWKPFVDYFLWVFTLPKGWFSFFFV